MNNPYEIWYLYGLSTGAACLLAAAPASSGGLFCLLRSPPELAQREIYRFLFAGFTNLPELVKLASSSATLFLLAEIYTYGLLRN